MAIEKPASSKGQAWFCTTGLPSDVVIEVDQMTFHLHKFPLMSKSRKIHGLITEQETNPTRVQTKSEEEAEEIEEEEDDEQEEEYCQISLPDFPGGSETFEFVAKFCYGVKIEISSSNVAPMRCAGEFLEMTDEYSEDNLISRTERFLSQSVYKNLKDSIKALKSCEKLMPLAETLGIVQNCIDSIAVRASHADPSIFGWPVNENGGASSTQALRNGVEAVPRRKSTTRGVGEDSWYDALALLSLSLFQRLISAMKARDLSPEIIETCLIYYAKRYIPGISRSTRKPSSSSVPSEKDQRELLETIVSNLPQENNSRSPTTARILFGLLRTANILNASDKCRSALEKKIGSQLDQATLDDLLITSYSYLNETLYDVDCIERIFGYFLDGLEERPGIILVEGVHNNQGIKSAALMLVGKLMDGYLSEIASDSNLKPDKFYKLALSVPERARLFDDGLYRAVDVYLKAHPWLPEAEREKISGLIDCQKLTLEGCTHAAQNERLPLRAVVQVLFFEQLQLRQAIAGTLLATEGATRVSNIGREDEEEEEEDDDGVVTEARGVDSGGTWRVAVRENQVLKVDMDSMRSRVHELERECSTMKKAIARIGKVVPSDGRESWRNSITKKIGCKFRTQVCDSHEPTTTIINPKRGRNHPHQE